MNPLNQVNQKCLNFTNLPISDTILIFTSQLHEGWKIVVVGGYNSPKFLHADDNSSWPSMDFSFFFHSKKPTGVTLKYFCGHNYFWFGLWTQNMYICWQKCFIKCQRTDLNQQYEEYFLPKILQNSLKLSIFNQRDGWVPQSGYIAKVH